MATRTENANIGRRAERAGDGVTGRHDETRWALLTTEFYAAVVVIIATLIAAAVADNFDAPGAWWITGVITTGFIVSRGLAKSGEKHRHDGRENR
jgi:hypothetical protein